MEASPQPPDRRASARKRTFVRPRFTGSGSEYFRIWIVNFLLTLLTLGVYIPWARVRTRRYFYRHTRLHGETFDYTADPRKLLAGYAIVAVFLLGYSFGEFVVLWLPLLFFGLFAVLYPWIRWKSVRFFARHSTYRHVPLTFTRENGEAYKTFLLLPFLGLLTFGILAPYAAFRSRLFYFGGFRYGNAPSRFHGRPGYFYKVYALAGVAAVGGFLFLVFLSTFFSYLLLEEAMTARGDAADRPAAIVRAAAADPANEDTGETEPPAAADADWTKVEEDPEDWDLGGDSPFEEDAAWFEFGILASTLFAYLVLFVVFTAVRVILLNYAWNHTTLRAPSGAVSFRSRLSVFRYCWILLSNIVLSLVTLGVFVPFAKVRLYRYRLDCLRLFGFEHIESATGGKREPISAVGESAADWLDIEFGL